MTSSHIRIAIAQSDDWKPNGAVATGIVCLVVGLPVCLLTYLTP